MKCCKHCHMPMPPDGKKEYCTMWCKRLAEQSPCPVCGRVFLPSKQSQVYCSVKCQHDTLKKEKPIHICENCKKEFERMPNTKDSCKFCSRECAFKYRRQHPESVSSYTGGKINGYREGDAAIIHFKSCRVCRKTFVARYKNSTICSNDCRAAYCRDSARARAMTEYYKALKPKDCVICGKGFFVKYGQRTLSTCSDLCSKALHSRHRSTIRRSRRARLRNQFIETVSLEYLFFRDQGRCQICGKKLRLNREVPHKLAATMDHIIPLASGGEHSKRNTQLACFMCNSVKSDKHGGSGDQLFLFG